AVHQVALPHRHERLRPQVLDPDVGPVGEGVVGRQDDHHRAGEQTEVEEAGGRVVPLQDVDQPEVETAGEQVLVDGGLLGVDDLDPAVGVLDGQRAQGRVEQGRGGGADGA